MTTSGKPTGHFNDKNVLITGGSAGIGRATAELSSAEVGSLRRRIRHQRLSKKGLGQEGTTDERRTRDSLDRNAELMDAQRTRRASVGGAGLIHDKEPTFLTAIALELANLHGGTAERYLRSARQMSEESFRNVEREEHAVRRRRLIDAA